MGGRLLLLVLQFVSPIGQTQMLDERGPRKHGLQGSPAYPNTAGVEKGMDEKPNGPPWASYEPGMQGFLIATFERCLDL